MRGLFFSKELIADNVKDKETKTIFLQKLIKFLNIALEKNINIKISNIIAGKECEKTNEMLFLLAELVKKKVILFINYIKDKQ